jgi:hypothetical protein
MPTLAIHASAEKRARVQAQHRRREPEGRGRTPTDRGGGQEAQKRKTVDAGMSSRSRGTSVERPGDWRPLARFARSWAPLKSRLPVAERHEAWSRIRAPVFFANARATRAGIGRLRGCAAPGAPLDFLSTLRSGSRRPFDRLCAPRAADMYSSPPTRIEGCSVFRAAIGQAASTSSRHRSSQWEHCRRGY